MNISYLAINYCFISILFITSLLYQLQSEKKNKQSERENKQKSIKRFFLSIQYIQHLHKVPTFFISISWNKFLV